LVGAGLLLLTLLNPVHLPVLAVGEGERVLQTWQSSSAIVAVVEQEGNLLIKVDNHYSLGGSSSLQHESRQGSFPLLLHPFPRDVFYLGLGTGITAGAAMPHPVERVTVCEIIPDAITAAARYFGPYTQGLFEDSRTRILAEDGRTFLAATADTFDVVVADLFIPWKAGIGSLYTREHFEAARARLGDSGLYAQWLPLFQLSRPEVEVIARTMVDVFPLVTMWRGDFFERRSIAVLIGHAEDRPLAPEWIRARLEETPDPNLLVGGADNAAAAGFTTFMLGYCGNLTAARSMLEGVPLNTDDRPLIEYRAPVTQREVLAHRTRWMQGEDLVSFYSELQDAVPAEKDPYLQNLDPVLFGYVDAGLLVQTGRVYRAEGREEEAERYSSRSIRTSRGPSGRRGAIRRAPQTMRGTRRDSPRRGALRSRKRVSPSTMTRPIRAPRARPNIPPSKRFRKLRWANPITRLRTVPIRVATTRVAVNTTMNDTA
jgi:spermidine synthase